VLRRRRKPAKIESRAPQPGPPGARRRGRPDAPVPAELFVRHDSPAPAPAPKPAAPRSAAGAAKSEDVVLVAGFEPFGGEASNPSWEICTRLPRTIGGLRVETCRVPCAFRRSIEVVAAAIERHQPTLVVCLGQAGGRAHLSVERVAINVDDARIADNAGERPVDEAIAPEGPPAYFATLPVKAMAAAMRAAGAPAEVSNTAGTYVCNHLMYGVLHFLAASGRAARAGFIHVPYAEHQVLDKPGVPALSIETMAKGVEAAIAAARRHARDVKVSEGKLD
jgi:pyroglutamyl-peptidase